MPKHKRVTIIPVIKDEGKDGEFDLVAWDTISLMSLLGVFVVFGYYESAVQSKRKDQLNKEKLTAQKFNYEQLFDKLKELEKYKSDALHWNLTQLDHLDEILAKAKRSYQDISRKTGVQIHSFRNIDACIAMLQKEVAQFKEFSRKKSAAAQEREYQTLQPKESLVAEKAKITITNYLGGEYFLTVDELIVKQPNVFLIEKKHTKKKILPDMGSIKDGLLKMMLFANLSDVQVGGETLRHFAVLGLTSDAFKGFVDNTSGEVGDKRVRRVFNEGRQNNFIAFLMNTSEFERQKAMIDKYIVPQK